MGSATGVDDGHSCFISEYSVFLLQQASLELIEWLVLWISLFVELTGVAGKSLGSSWKLLLKQWQEEVWLLGHKIQLESHWWLNYSDNCCNCGQVTFTNNKPLTLNFCVGFQTKAHSYCILCSKTSSLQWENIGLGSQGALVANSWLEPFTPLGPRPPATSSYCRDLCHPLPENPGCVWYWQPGV